MPFARQLFSALKEALAARLRPLARWPFVRLVRHFVSRLVRGGSEFDPGVSGLLGLLAAPGAFTCFLLLDKYSSLLRFYRRQHRVDPYIASIPDKYFFIVLSMAVTGIVAILKWDKILPDRQDYLNLAPLPVRPAKILLANAAAIFIAVAVCAIDVNAVSALFFPMFVMADQPRIVLWLEFVAAHAACVLLASAFTFCAVAAVMGALSALLPARLFRASSSWVRGIILIALVGLLSTASSGSELMRRFEHAPGSIVRLLPSLWYLALYQSLQNRAGPSLSALANAGLRSAASAFAVMAVSYLLSYRRTFFSVAEGTSKPPGRSLSAPALWVLDLFAVGGNAFERACHRFVIRGLLRNDAHCLCIGASAGFGWILALQAAAETSALSPPLIASYLLICGLRIAFELPAGLPCNWIFRAVLNAPDCRAGRVAGRVMLSFLTPLVLIPCLVAYSIRSGAGIAIVHTLYVLGLSMLLVDALLLGFRKIPLTCPPPSFRNNALVLCLAGVLGFVAFTGFGASLESWMFARPLRFLVCPAIGLVWWQLRQRLHENTEVAEGIIFEDAPSKAVLTLDLSDGR